MRALRHGVERGDLAALIFGAGTTIALALATARLGTKIGAGSFLLVSAFLVVVVAWVFVPHIVTALAIPLFATLPAIKLFVTPWLGPVKDLVTLAAAAAILVNVLQRERRRDAVHVDHVVITLVVMFVGLYVVNLGGDLSSGQNHGIAWAQGLRLILEPFILLIAGLTFTQPRRTLNFAVPSLLATGLIIALYGAYQQHLGAARLVDLGYTYNKQVGWIAGRLRSFGTLDDPFIYSAFLLLAVSAALFWMHRGPLKVACISVLAVGVLLAYVRSAILISVVLIAIWLISLGRLSLGLLLLGASAAAALAFLIAISGAKETSAVRAGPNTYVTLNGRTSAWATVFGRPSRVPFGLGVGKVGTAARRAQVGVTADARNAQKKIVVVDSGYFATVGDVGLVGLAVFLALIARLLSLGISAAKRRDRAGWLVIGWLAVLLCDAVTRESFTGFPTVHLCMLLVGIGIAASAQSRGRLV